MKDFQFVIEKNPQLSDAFELLDSKVKAALTRLYNNTEHRSQALVDQQLGGKGKGRGSSGGPANGGGNSNNEFVAADDDVIEEDEGEEDQDANVSAFMKKGKRKESSGAKAPSGKKSKKK